MLKLDTVNFRRDIRLYWSYMAPRSWERVDKPKADTEHHKWDMQITDDLRFIVIKNIAAPMGNPLGGKVYYVPVDAESVESFEISVQLTREEAIKDLVHHGVIAPREAEEMLTKPIKVSAPAPKAPAKK